MDLSDKKMSEIERIFETGGLVLLPHQLEDYVEWPALATCRYLYDLGICTVSSTANAYHEVASVSIADSALSDNNKRILVAAAEKWPDNISVCDGGITLKIPLTADEHAGDVSNRLLQHCQEIGLRKQPAFGLVAYYSLDTYVKELCAHDSLREKVMAILIPLVNLASPPRGQKCVASVSYVVTTEDGQEQVGQLRLTAKDVARLNEKMGRSIPCYYSVEDRVVFWRRDAVSCFRKTVKNAQCTAQPAASRPQPI